MRGWRAEGGPRSGPEGCGAAARRAPEVRSRFSQTLPPVEDLCEKRNEEGTERQDKYHQGGDIVRQMPEMHPEESSFLPRPLRLRIPRLHEQAHEAGDLLGLVEKQGLVLRNHSRELILHHIEYGTAHEIVSASLDTVVIGNRVSFGRSENPKPTFHFYYRRISATI